VSTDNPWADLEAHHLDLFEDDQITPEQRAEFVEPEPENLENV
jgi:hypothetical protein